MKIEYSDFYKFVVSIGVGIISLAILIPWLFLREPFDLFHSQEDLSLLTPLAQSIIERRLSLLKVAMTVIPCTIMTLFVVGLVLVALGGVLWWKNNQRILDEKHRLDLEALKRQLGSLPETEILAQQEGEATADITQEIDGRDLVEEIALERDDFVRTANEVETSLANIFKRCLSSSYEILVHKRLGMVYFDLLMLAKERADRDYIVEIRYIKRGFKYNWLRDNLFKISYAGIIFEKETGRQVLPILVIAGPQEIFSKVDTMKYAERLHQEMLRRDIAARFVPLNEESIADLDCNAIKEIFDW